MDEFDSIYRAKSKLIQELQKQLPDGDRTLTAENLQKLGVNPNAAAIDDDAMSEFSVMTTESEIEPQQNVLDIRVSETRLDKGLLNMKLGTRDLLPSAIQTFVTLAFFDHDTKHTDINSGYEPSFNTIFSFKNKVDDFYLKYLQNEYVIAEVFAVKGSGAKVTEKIGEAKLPLVKVLMSDHGIQF